MHAMRSHRSPMVGAPQSMNPKSRFANKTLRGSISEGAHPHALPKKLRLIEKVGWRNCKCMWSDDHFLIADVWQLLSSKSMAETQALRDLDWEPSVKERSAQTQNETGSFLE